MVVELAGANRHFCRWLCTSNVALTVKSLSGPRPHDSELQEAVAADGGGLSLHRPGRGRRKTREQNGGEGMPPAAVAAGGEVIGRRESCSQRGCRRGTGPTGDPKGAVPPREGAVPGVAGGRGPVERRLFCALHVNDESRIDSGSARFVIRASSLIWHSSFGIRHSPSHGGSPDAIP